MQVSHEYHFLDSVNEVTAKSSDSRNEKNEQPGNTYVNLLLKIRVAGLNAEPISNSPNDQNIMPCILTQPLAAPISNETTKWQ